MARFSAPSPSLVQKSFVAFYDNPTPAKKGAIVACFQVGALFGSLGVGLMSDRLGRRKTMFCGSLFGILGGALMTGSVHIAMLVIGRLLLGVFVGLITGTAPIYAAEIAKAKERGRISAAQQLLIAFGFLVANWTGYGFKFTTGNKQWRGPFGLQIVPAAILACGIFLFPESPRWLMLVDRPEEARAALMRFHYDGTNEQFINDEFEEIRAHVTAEKLVVKPGFRSAISTPSRRRRLALGCGVWIFAMLSGISFIQYFQPSIYKTLNFSVDKQLLVTGLYGSMGPIFCLLNLFVIDRVGRVTLLAGAGFTLSTLYCIITALSAKYPAIPGTPYNAAAQYVIVACVFGISCVFSATLGPLGWVYPPEVFQTQLRGIGNSLVHICHYATSIMIAQASPVGLANIGWRYYIFFCITNAVSGFVFLFFYPETRGRTLEEIDQIFGDDAVEQVQGAGFGSGRPASVRSYKDKSSV